MILYTEKQLREAYKTYIENLNNIKLPITEPKAAYATKAAYAKSYIPIPTLEEFRIMYEEYYSKVHISNE